MEENKNNLEERAKEIIKSQENEESMREEMKKDAPASADLSAYRSLGNVNDRRQTFESEDDARIERVKSKLGHIELIQDNLPSKGRFYPIGTKIFIRAASVKEVRSFSTIDETNPMDVDEKLNDILLSCIKVELGPRRGSFKDILEEDRLYILLSIRELTFKNGENQLMLSPNKLDCKSDECAMDKKYELKTSNLQFYEENDTIERYYNESERLYVIQTKSSGTIRMAPPTIGVMRVVTDYIQKREQEKKSWDKAFLQVIPYLQRDWRGFDEKALFNAEVEYQGWDMTKYTTIFRLAEKMRVGVKQEMTHGCDKCGAEVIVPVDFPGGIKSLFIIPDIDEELL
jgi:hypothetical protein